MSKRNIGGTAKRAFPLVFMNHLDLTQVAVTCMTQFSVSIAYNHLSLLPYTSPTTHRTHRFLLQLGLSRGQQCV